MLAAGMITPTARALEKVFEDHAIWNRVFGAHPEVTQSIEAGEFPSGSVGAYLKEAIAISRSQRRGQVGPNNSDPSVQDESYEGEDERSA